jgi:hypothetical protein
MGSDDSFLQGSEQVVIQLNPDGARLGSDTAFEERLVDDEQELRGSVWRPAGDNQLRYRGAAPTACSTMIRNKNVLCLKIRVKDYPLSAMALT